MGFGRIRFAINKIPKKGPTTVKKLYENREVSAEESATLIEEFCQAIGQILLPIVQLIEGASQAVEKVCTRSSSSRCKRSSC